MADIKDLKDKDLYGLLNIQISATTKEVCIEFNIKT